MQTDQESSPRVAKGWHCSRMGRAKRLFLSSFSRMAIRLSPCGDKSPPDGSACPQKHSAGTHGPPHADADGPSESSGSISGPAIVQHHSAPCQGLELTGNAAGNRRGAPGTACDGHGVRAPHSTQTLISLSPAESSGSATATCAVRAYFVNPPRLSAAVARSRGAGAQARGGRAPSAGTGTASLRTPDPAGRGAPSVSSSAAAHAQSPHATPSWRTAPGALGRVAPAGRTARRRCTAARAPAATPAHAEARARQPAADRAPHTRQHSAACPISTG